MKPVIDTAIAAFTAATLVVVVTQGEELGKAQVAVVKDVQTALGAKQKQ
jgi:hypothetical protein